MPLKVSLQPSPPASTTSNNQNLETPSEKKQTHLSSSTKSYHSSKPVFTDEYANVNDDDDCDNTRCTNEYDPVNYDTVDNNILVMDEESDEFDMDGSKNLGNLGVEYSNSKTPLIYKDDKIITPTENSHKASSKINITENVSEYTNVSFPSISSKNYSPSPTSSKARRLSTSTPSRPDMKQRETQNAAHKEKKSIPEEQSEQEQQTNITKKEVKSNANTNNMSTKNKLKLQLELSSPTGPSSRKKNDQNSKTSLPINTSINKYTKPQPSKSNSTIPSDHTTNVSAPNSAIPNLGPSSLYTDTTTSRQSTTLATGLISNSSSNSAQVYMNVDSPGTFMETFGTMGLSSPTAGSETQAFQFTDPLNLQTHPGNASGKNGKDLIKTAGTSGTGSTEYCTVAVDEEAEYH